MATLEQAARAWIDLGRVMYPSLAEVEASLASHAHPDVIPIRGTPEDPPTLEED